MEPNGIIFDVQWKSRISRSEVASIGIWDTTDSTLNWAKFKSYLCQNVGTTQDLSVEYVDSEGDEVPIDTELEFQEALKFARKRARQGKKIILKLNREAPSPPAVPCHQTKSTNTLEAWNNMKREVKLRTYGRPKQSGKSAYDKGRSSTLQHGMKDAEEKAARSRKHAADADRERLNRILNRLEWLTLQETEKRKEELNKPAQSDDSADAPPPWFKKYMKKWKSEVVSDLMAAVMMNNRSLLLEAAKFRLEYCASMSQKDGERPSTSRRSKHASAETEHAEKLIQDIISSEVKGAKLLKKLEKMHKKELKLDSKLEKLEHKAKRRESVEKKIHPPKMSQPPKICDKKQSSSRKRSSESSGGPYLMDAILLKKEIPAELNVYVGENFTKTWEIMNNGTLPWTDKTELRLAWGSLGFEPEHLIVRCPILKPGEKGHVSVTFKAPDFPGTFESYWHFYHMGERFGHWISCNVTVTGKPEALPVSAVVDLAPGNVDEEGQLDEVLLDDNGLPEEDRDEGVDEGVESDEDDEGQLSVASCSSTATTVPIVSDSEVPILSDSEEDRDNFVVVSMPACFKMSEPLPDTDGACAECSVPKHEEEMAAGIKITPTEELLLTDSEDDGIVVAKPKEMKQKQKKSADKSSMSSASGESSVQGNPSTSGIQDSSYTFKSQPQPKSSTSVSRALSHTSKFAGHPGFVNESVDQLGPSAGRVVDPEDICPTRLSLERNFVRDNWQYVCQQDMCPDTHFSMNSRYDAHRYPGAFKVYHEAGIGYTQRSEESAPGVEEQAADPRGIGFGRPDAAVKINAAPASSAPHPFVISHEQNDSACPETDDRQTEESESLAETRTTSKNLKLLLEMGFKNVAQNTLMLQRYDNDLESVVCELLSREMNA